MINEEEDGSERRTEMRDGSVSIAVHTHASQQSAHTQSQSGNKNKGRTLSYKMPPRRVKRIVGSPARDIRAIHVARGVLERIRRSDGNLGVERGEGVHVGAPGVGVEDVKGLFSACISRCETKVRMRNEDEDGAEGGGEKPYVRVDFVHPETGVEVRQWCDRGTYLRNALLSRPSLF